jgi:inner membrane protein
MENLAHSLTGLALARAGLQDKIPFGAVPLVVAANLPDADVIAGYFGSLYYIHYHRGITHSIAGTLVLGLLVGGLAWLLRRWSQAPDARLSASLAAALLAAASHPLLDLTNSYGLWPYLPFSDSPVFGDLVFIVDPYIWVILGTGVYLSSRQGRTVRILWITGTMTALAILLLFARVEPRALWAVFAVGLAAGAVLSLRGRRFGPLASAGSLFGLMVYWSFLLISHQSAWVKVAEQVREAAPLPPSQPVAVLPRPVDPLNWSVFYSDGEFLHSGVAGSFSNSRTAFKRVPTNRSRPEVQAAMETCPGKVLSLFGRFEYYQVDQNDKGPGVTFRDARFSLPGDGGRDGFGTYRIQLDDSLRLAPPGTPCPDPR